MQIPLLQINHFCLTMDLPQQATIKSYVSSGAKKDKKHKNKLDKFSYYTTKDGKIIKLLFRDSQSYLFQGQYPFTDPQTAICKLDQLNSLNPQRLFVTESAYIGHMDNKVIVKKMQDVCLQLGKIEIETKDDNFETIQIKNDKRFHQFLTLMQKHPRSAEMSIRVFVNQSNSEKPQVIDFEFFYREEELKKNKNLFGK